MRPQLSIVVALGPEALLPVAPLFLRATLAQLRRHAATAELILVDWTPPVDRTPLRQLLDLASCNAGDTRVRVITVPAAQALAAGHDSALGFRERVAQNVGIRRSNGSMVLATTMEMLLPDGLAAWLSQRESVDRIVSLPNRWLVFAKSRRPDGKELAPKTDIEDVLAWCGRAVGVIESYPSVKRFLNLPIPSVPITAESAHAHPTERAEEETKDSLGSLYGSTSFLLADAALWQAVRGFPEWPVHDQFLDRLVLMLARRAGYRVEKLPPELYYFHLYELRQRLTDRPIPVARAGDGTKLIVPDQPWPVDFYQGQADALLPELAQRIAALPADALVYTNGLDWGLGGITLPETELA